MIWSIPIGNNRREFYGMEKNLKDKKFCVYMHIFPNGKKYIGITCKKPNKRWENGAGYREGSPMRNAVNKYGWENIEHVILFEGLTQEEACQKEIEMIAKYKTNIHKYGDTYGYNMTDGGEGATGHKLTIEQVEKMRQVKLGKVGKDCPNSKPVICDGVEYESLTDFKVKNNFPKGNISAWLTGKVGMPKEWYDRGLCYKDLGFSIVKQAQNKNRSRKLIADGIVFNTLEECGKYFNTSASSICLYLSGKQEPPLEVVKTGLRYEDEDAHNFKQSDKRRGTKVKCEIDGIVFESQAALSQYINENKATVWAWLTGVNQMPTKYKERGLRTIE